MPELQRRGAHQLLFKINLRLLNLQFSEIPTQVGLQRAARTSRAKLFPVAIPKPVLAAEKHAGSLLHPCSGLCFPSVARQLQKRHLLNFQIPRQNVFCLPVGRASLLHAGEAARTKGQQTKKPKGSPMAAARALR